ncbi:tRNA pseudouridine(55) synthase TruB [Halobacillus litoralis]|uniref:tRNA pseudouridine(55) synthase TruB n=1 Tax=Halobacillus litoralis TaxID=45668 RepID=UPI002491D6DD|nr:tRNA pseudouridine(55) synthase TruB [Halobacillus litoralis]
MDGILPLWKPEGFTSHDCVSKARGMLKTKKIGHTGTLDPDVEGVLPLCVGKATKIVPFLTDTDKVYEAVVTLGTATDTEDSSGQIVESKEVTENIPYNEIEDHISSFQGEITQTPPMYSAVRVNGKRLYEYAREGIEVDRPSRQVLIKEISILSKDEEVVEGEMSFSLRVVCSKGTYIRTLCVDIGKTLGYPAHMSSLVRTKTGGITRDECYTLAQVQEKADEQKGKELLLPLSRGLSDMVSWEVDEEWKVMIQHGRVLTKPSHIDAETFAVVHDKEVIAIYQQHPSKPGYVKPVRVF